MRPLRHAHLCIGTMVYSTVTTVRIVRHALFMVTGSNHSHRVAQTQRVVSAPRAQPYACKPKHIPEPRVAELYPHGLSHTYAIGPASSSHTARPSLSQSTQRDPTQRYPDPV